MEYSDEICHLCDNRVATCIYYVKKSIKYVCNRCALKELEANAYQQKPGYIVAYKYWEKL